MASSDLPAASWTRIRAYIFLGLLGGVTLSILLLIQQNQAIITPFDGWAFLYRLFWRSLWSLGFVTFALVMAEQLARRQPTARPGFLTLLALSLFAVLIMSMTTTAFQFLFSRVLQPEYFQMQREQAISSLEAMGIADANIRDIVEGAYNTQQFLSDTFLYFFFLGSFVALMVSAYFYKRPSFRKMPPLDTSLPNDQPNLSNP